MILNKFIQSIPLQRACRAAIVVFFAAYIGHYLSLAEEFWIPAVALFMVQTVVGLNMHRGLQWLLAIVLGVLLASYLVFYLKNSVVSNLLACLFFSAVCYFSVTQLGRMRTAIFLLIAAFVLIALILPCLSTQIIHARSFDVMIGGGIGLISSIVIFPVAVDVDFRRKVIPLLNASADYLSVIVDSLFDPTIVDRTTEKKHQLEDSWKNFPGWIYEAGFTPLLQQGHRHFLVRIEHLRQILYVLHYLARYRYDESLLQELHRPMQLYLEKVEKLFQAVIAVLMLQKLSEGVEDISESFYGLEDKLNEILPFSLEGLEVKQEYIYLTQFIDELKELGKMLLILAQALR